MSQFTTPLIAEFIGKNQWKLYQGFEYHVGSYPSNEVIKIPAGFVTDCASVPRIFWTVISPVDRHAKAAVVHDYVCRQKIYKRKKCDLIFKEGLTVLEIIPWKVYAMYYSVRLFSIFRYEIWGLD